MDGTRLSMSKKCKLENIDGSCTSLRHTDIFHNRSNLAIDMAWMYEHVEINKRYDTYAIVS